jgi:hypothetical protein
MFPELLKAFLPVVNADGLEIMAKEIAQGGSQRDLLAAIKCWSAAAGGGKCWARDEESQEAPRSLTRRGALAGELAGAFRVLPDYSVIAAGTAGS